MLLVSVASNLAQNVQQRVFTHPVLASVGLSAFLLLAYLFSPVGNKRPAKKGLISNSKVIQLDADTSAKPEYDVVIIGAGVVGAATAAILGRKGVRVLVVERDLTEPDRIVGELLQPSGVEQLKKLGLEGCLEGIDGPAVPGYAVFWKGRQLHLVYPKGEQGNASFGRGFHNGRFVMKLREAAMKEKTVTVKQGIVTKMLQRADGRVTGIVYKDSNDQEIKVRGSLTMLVDGCLSPFRKELCEPSINVTSKFLGLVLKDCKVPYELHGHVILADPSPVLVYPISATEQRMLIDFPLPQGIPNEKPGMLTKYLMEKICPQLPETIKPSFIRAVEEAKEKFPSMPNQSMLVEPFEIEGCMLIGDAFNMRHPLTGGGMTVGFTDLVVLTDALSKVKNWENTADIATHIDTFYQARKGKSSVINVLADALYAVFTDKDLGEACFDYLSIGTITSNGPISLLSGLNRSQWTLTKHFFAVAFYCVFRALPRLQFKKAYRSLRLACQIIVPLLVRENAGRFVYGRLSNMLHAFTKVIFWY